MTTELLTRPAPRLWSPADLEILDDATRREFLAGMAAAGLLVATGCGRDDGDDSADPQAGSQNRPVRHALGTTDVPVDPQRVVALDAYSTLQVLDELDTPLVAAGSLGGRTRVLVGDDTDSLPTVADTVEVNLEAVAASRPDLIVSLRFLAEERYQELSAIAPTVVIEQSPDWREVVRETAASVGRSDRAEKLLAQVAERTAELREAVDAAWPDGFRVTVLRVFDASGGALSYTSGASGFIYAQILTDLGVTVTGDGLSPDGAGGGPVELSPEQLADADADVVLYYAGGGASSGEEVADLTAALTDNPLWSTLQAVQDGRARQVEAGPWFDGGNTQAAQRVLDDLFAHLTGT